MIPIAVLVLAAGAAYLWRRAGGRRPGRRRWKTAGPSLPRPARVLGVVLLLVLARGYLGPIVNGWPFPRGVDRYEHAVMAGMMMRSGSTESFMLYPPGFHLLTAMISRLSGVGPLGDIPDPRPHAPAAVRAGLLRAGEAHVGVGVRGGGRPHLGLLLGSTYLQFEEARCRTLSASTS